MTRRTLFPVLIILMIFSSPGWGQTGARDTLIVRGHAFLFDSLHQLTRLITPAGKERTYEWNARYQLVREAFPDGQSYFYLYNGKGLLLSRRDASGQVTRFHYDAQDRLVRRDYPGDNDDTLSYDQHNRLTTARNRHARLSFDYDDRDRLIREVLNGKATHYVYDSSGRRRLLLYPSGRAIEEEYDRMGKPLLVRELTGVSYLPTLTYPMIAGWTFADTLAQYDHRVSGHRSLLTLGNGVQVCYFYDFNNQLVGQQHSNASCLDHHYEWLEDARAWNVFRPDSSEMTTVAFDEQGRWRTFSRTSPGSRLQLSVTYDEDGHPLWFDRNGQRTVCQANALGGVVRYHGPQGSTSFRYQDNYRLADDGVASFVYDPEGRLRQIGLSASLLYPGQIMDFQYDPLGRLIRRQLLMEEPVEYYYAGERAIEIQDQGALRSLVYEPGTPTLLHVREDGQERYHQPDIWGRVLALSDSRGRLEEYYQYVPFQPPLIFDGSGRRLTQARFQSPLLLGGLEWYPRWSLFRYGNRFYRMDTGQSLTLTEGTAAPDPFPAPVGQPHLLSWPDLPWFAPQEVVLGTGSTEENILNVWAELASGGDSHPFRDGKELLQLLRDHSTLNRSIRKWYGISHGWGFPRTRGFEVNGGIYGTLWTNGFLADIPAGHQGKDFTISSRARDLRDLQAALLLGDIRFAQPCSIILTGCRIANTGNFVERLAILTGCSVLSSHGGCDGTRAPFFTSLPKSLAEREVGDYRGFSVTYPNGQRFHIGYQIVLW